MFTIWWCSFIMNKWTYFNELLSEHNMPYTYKVYCCVMLMLVHTYQCMHNILVYAICCMHLSLIYACILWHMCCLINYYDSLLSLFILNYTSREHQDTHALHLNNQLLMWSKHPLECICIIQLFRQFSVMNALRHLCISKHAYCLSFSQEPSFILYNYTGNVHDYATRAQCLCTTILITKAKASAAS